MAVGNCTLPTIAAVNGAAVGAGLNLALAADVRIAGPHAMFDPRFQKLGIHPGGGATWMLQRGVGPQVARAALLFGMRFDADAAVAHGLALTKADDAVAAALELAAGPANAPREVVLATKASMRATATPGSVDTDLHHTRDADRTRPAGHVDPVAGVPEPTGRRAAPLGVGQQRPELRCAPRPATARPQLAAQHGCPLRHPAEADQQESDRVRGDGAVDRRPGLADQRRPIDHRKAVARHLRACAVRS